MASEDYATEGQIKRLYAVLHSIGMDPKQWKKDKNIASYAKLTRAQCSAFIDDAEAIEAEQKREIQEIKETSGRGIPGEKPGVPRGSKGSQPAATTTDRAEAEAQRIREEQGLATAPVVAQTPVPISTKPTVAELIEKYLNILVQVTLKVKASEEVSEREKGYATNWVCDAVKDAMQTGGDREE